MATKLRDLIRNIRSCKTAAEERALISKEKAAIRNSFTEGEEEYRARNIAKLLFVNMLGHDTDFGQIECLKLITSQNYSDKKIGYLGLTQLFNEKSEVLMMATHRMRTDLQSGTHYVTALALSSLSEITTADMCKELAPEVAKLMINGNNYIKKKAALAATRIVRRVPELADDFIDKIPKLMEERHHGVLLSTISLVIEILGVDIVHKEKFKKYVPFLVKVLKNLVSSYSAEFDISGIIDPFLQIEIVKFFGIMGEKDDAVSEEINDILTQVATNTPANKNTGNAVLFECVRTIMKIESSNTLKALAIGILGKFLSSKESNARNLRYVALQSLQNVVKFDMASVQKHKAIILECIRENDLSIKKLALDVLYLITNEKNIESIVKELLNSILVSEPEFLEDLTQKICASVERYSPDRRWHIDTIIKVLTLAGNSVQDESIYSLLHLISATPQLQTYSVTKLFFSLRENTNQEGLAKVAFWCMGEYGTQLISGKATSSDNTPIRVSEKEVIGLIDKVIRRFGISELVKEYALNSLIKLYTKFPNSKGEIKNLIDSQTTSSSLEVQQRACEYLQLLESEWDEVRHLILEPIPQCKVVSIDISQKPVGDTTIWEVPPSSTTERRESNVSTTASTTTSQGGLLDDELLGPSTSLTSTPINNTQPTQQPISGSSSLLDDIVLIPSTQQTETKPTGGLGGINLMGLYGNNTQPQPTTNLGFGGGLSGLNFGTQQQPTTNTQSGGSLLDNISFGGSNNGFNLGGSTTTTTTTQSDSSKLTIKALEDNNLEIVFNCTKEGFDTTVINTSFNNKSSSQINNLALKVAAGKGLNLSLNPITSTTIPGNSSGAVTQSMKVQNPMQGKKAIAFKLKVTYDIGGQNFSNEATVSAFPQTY